MILFKAAITVAIVTALSIIAERVSPRVAGILAGYPLGAAIALFFIGMEQGAAFAGASAPYTLVGLAALLSFTLIYYWVSDRLRNARRALAILLTSLASVLGFFAVDGLLHVSRLPGWSGPLVAAASILGFGALFRRIPDARIVQQVRLGPGVVLFRALLATLIILAITGAADLVPPSWAGLFSIFPSTLFPLLLIIHGTYGPEQAHTIIKNLPTGLWALVLYALTVWAAYPRIGIYWGTLVGFGAATVYLLALAYITRRARGTG